MLKAEGIIKKYQIPGRKKDLLEALSGVSIELADNSITAIVGESGSGKSTLARILSYIELPDAGKVTLDNLTVTGVKRKTLQKMAKCSLSCRMQPVLLILTKTYYKFWMNLSIFYWIWEKRTEKRESKNCWTWLI